MRSIRRGGRYFRVCDPSWIDPSDTSYSKVMGGRWNPPDSTRRPGFGALYLNRSLAAARENARRHVRRHFGDAVTLADLAPAVQPDLQHYDVIETAFLDAVTPEGIGELRLPARYPEIPHPRCQVIARRAYAHFPGVAALCTVAPAEEELAVFDRALSALVRKRQRESFAGWFDR